MATIDEEFQIIKDYVNAGIGEYRKVPKNAKFKHGDTNHLISLKKKFENERKVKLSIDDPETLTDDALWEYIKLQKNLSEEETLEYAKYHKIAMSVETKLGTILESFIYQNIKEYGWIWCSGSVIRDIDFLKKNDDGWTALQVKNSDNSENSPASRVRVGTEIIKWFRRYSRKDGDNWNELCKLVTDDQELKKNLNEEKYLEYLKSKN